MDNIRSLANSLSIAVKDCPNVLNDLISEIKVEQNKLDQLQKKHKSELEGEHVQSFGNKIVFDIGEF